MIPARLCWYTLLAYALFVPLAGRGHHTQKSASADRELQQAVEKGDFASAERALNQGANVEARDESRIAPLMAAARSGQTEMVKLLLGEIPKVDLQKSADEALFFAIENQPVILVIPGPNTQTEAQLSRLTNSLESVVNLLLRSGSGVQGSDVEGATPFIRAAAFGQLSITEFLLHNGSDLEARDKWGRTALIAAACDCAAASMPDTYEIIKLLLDRGAQINATDNDGNTSLMVASEGGVVKTDIVKLLIARGAKLGLKNKAGQTALALALQGDNPEVVRLLKGALAKHH
jgi:ankyrin repeat protein